MTEKEREEYDETKEQMIRFKMIRKTIETKYSQPPGSWICNKCHNTQHTLRYLLNFILQQLEGQADLLVES